MRGRFMNIPRDSAVLSCSAIFQTVETKYFGTMPGGWKGTELRAYPSRISDFSLIIDV